MENNMKITKEKMSIFTLVILSLILFVVSMNFGMTIKSSADTVNQEDVLLQKSNVIDSLVEYQSCKNKYVATSKSVALSNLDINKLEKLNETGYKIIIIGGDSSKSDTVSVENKKILVPIYSADGDVIDVVNSVLG